MNSSRHYFNENLNDRSTYLIWLLIVDGSLIGFQFISPALRPNYYKSTTLEWMFTLSITILFTVYFSFHKRFVSITFDTSLRQITLSTASLINGTKSIICPYSEITFEDRMEAGSLRKESSKVISIYKNKQKLISIEQSTVGDYVYDNILNELEQMNKS